MDRTVKVLLALITAALWGLLLRPFAGLPPAQAAPAGKSASAATSLPAIAIAPSNGETIALVVQKGTLYRVDYSQSLYVTSQVKLK